MHAPPSRGALREEGAGPSAAPGHVPPAGGGSRARSLLLVPQDTRLASARIRVVAMAPWLERLGWRTSVVPYPRDRRAWSALERAAEGHALVLLQKRLPRHVEGLRWRRLAAPVVFDFDDALPFRQRPRRGSRDSWTRRRRFRRALRSSDAVVAGNAYLAGLCRGFRGPLLVLPSAVALPASPRSAETGPGAAARVGWIGGRGNLHELEALGPVLARVAARRALRLVVIADAAPELPGVAVEHVPWSLEGEAAALASLDLGLMPLADDAWTRGKCAYKALQYMASGVPPVVSPVGMSAEVVRDGRNGLVAGSAEEWERALLSLLDDPELRRRLGAEARATVEREYAYPVLAGRLSRFLEEVVAARRP